VAEPTPEPLSERWRWPAWLRKGDIHEWTRSLAVVVASLWGVYTFVWKDILVPSWAPASLVIEVTAQPEKRKPAVGVPQSAGSLPIQIQVTATNPTNRPLYLLANVWWAASIQRQEAANGSTFESAANEALIRYTMMNAERGQKLVSGRVLATGRLFADSQIQPGEKLSGDLSITLPSATSGVVFRLILPALTRNPNPDPERPSRLFGGRRISWAYSEQVDSVYPLLCLQAAPSDAAPECQLHELNALRRMILSFDRGAVIFTKTKMIFH